MSFEFEAVPQFPCSPLFKHSSPIGCRFARVVSWGPNLFLPMQIKPSDDLMESLVADADGLKGGHSNDGWILLDEDVLDAGLLRGCEDRLEGDVAAAYFGRRVFGVDAEVRRDGSVEGEVLCVHEWIAARILCEVVDGISAGSDHPAAVEFELDQAGISFAEEDLIAGVAVV